MRLGILSDIHGNIEALEAAWENLSKEACDKTVCAGDVVGYGGNPRECIDFIRTHGIETVRGNHDHYTAHPEQAIGIQPYALKALEWTRSILSTEHLAWLDGLPFRLDLEDVTIVHSSLEGCDNGCYWPYVLDAKTALLHFFLQCSRYAVFGHTHIPLLFVYDGRVKIEMEMLRDKNLGPSGRMRYLINPGSVGQPRDFDCRSSSAVLDTKTGNLKTLRNSYDVASAQVAICAAGLPATLATRLSRGS